MHSTLLNFAQASYEYETTTYSEGDAAAGLAFLGFFGFIYFLIFIFAIIPGIVTAWKIFKKAGKPGWASIVPVYNYMVMAEIAGKEAWFGLLMLVPFANFIVGIILLIEISKKFSNGTALVLTWLFIPIVSVFLVGKSEYLGEGAQKPAVAANPAATTQAVPTPTAPVTDDPEETNKSTPTQL